MRRIEVAEVLPLPAYEQVRDDFRRAVMAHKERRRVEVGDHFTFVFEDRKTVLFQIQEMLRTERVSEGSRVEAEVAIYNELIPNPGELSATLLLAYPREEVRARLAELKGLAARVWFEVGPLRVRGLFEAERESQEVVSAVQYLRFRFTDKQRAAFLDEETTVALVVDHPRYAHRVELPAPVRGSLAGDLADEAGR